MEEYIVEVFEVDDKETHIDEAIQMFIPSAQSGLFLKNKKDTESTQQPEGSVTTNE